LVRQLRGSIFIDDVGLEHPRRAGRHFVWEGGGALRPGQMHPLAGRNGAFRRLHVQRLWRLAGTGIQNEHPAIGPRRARIFEVVFDRSGQQDMTVRKKDRPGETVIGEVGGEVAEVFCPSLL